MQLATALPHVGSTFEINYPDGAVVSLQLTEATDLGSTPRQEQFALRFTTTHYLPQQTYVLTHAVLGERALFLVPVAREGDLYWVEAVFNRLLES